MTAANASDFERSLRILSEAVREQGATGEKLAEALGRIYEAITGLKAGELEIKALLSLVKDKGEEFHRMLADNSRDHKEILGFVVGLKVFIERVEKDNGPEGVKQAIREVFGETELTRKELFKAGVREVLMEPGTQLMIKSCLEDLNIGPTAKDIEDCLFNVLIRHADEQNAAAARELEAERLTQAAIEAKADTRDPGKQLLPFFRPLLFLIGFIVATLVWALVIREKDGGSLKVDKNGLEMNAGNKQATQEKK
jgi:hypothetical protein